MVAALVPFTVVDGVVVVFGNRFSSVLVLSHNEGSLTT